MILIYFFVIPLMLCGPMLFLDALDNWVNPFLKDRPHGT